MKRLELLMVVGYLPYAPVSGGRARTLGLLRALAGRANVSLVCLARDEERTHDLTALRELCDLTIVARPPSPTLGQAARMSALSMRPVTRQIYRSPDLTEALRRLIRERAFDLMHVESFYLLQNASAERPPLLLIDSAIEFVAWARHARAGLPAWQRPAFAFEAAKIRLAEPRAWREADAVGVVSRADAAVVARIAPEVRTFLTPNGVDVDRFTPGGVDRAGATAIFTGDYKYFPNVDAAIWFARDVLPRIRRAAPGFSIRLLGKDAPPAVRRLAGPGVELVGAVRDVRPHLRAAGLFVCPVRSGSGTRTKLLEALACACPVVTTTVGAEGLDLQEGREALFADSADDMAAAVLRVIADRSLAETIGMAGRRAVVSRHSWAVAGSMHEEAYRALLAR